MRLIALALLTSMGTMACAHDEALANRLEIKIEIIEQNYGPGVIHLPAFSRARALSITSLGGRIIHNDAEFCFADPRSDKPWELFERRYTRRPAPLTTEFSTSSYIVDLDVDVKSVFGISGDAKLAVNQSYQSPGNSFRIDVDSFDFDRNVLSVQNYEGCKVYYGLLESDTTYIEADRHVVANALFISGTVSQSFEIALTGSGRGTVSSNRIVEFLKKAGVPDRIARLFEVSSELSVGGGLVRSRETVHSFGSEDSFASAFLPLTISGGHADFMIDRVESIGGQEALDLALSDRQAAQEFLQKSPEFDFLSGQFQNLFAGEGLMLYSDYPVEKQIQIARFVSTILQINRLAKRI